MEGEVGQELLTMLLVPPRDKRKAATTTYVCMQLNRVCVPLCTCSTFCACGMAPDNRQETPREQTHANAHSTATSETQIGLSSEV